MYVSAIVLAAGRGLRFKSPISKPLLEINAKPIIIYCLNTISKHPDIKDIIIVANRKNFKSIIRKIKQYRIKKVKQVVLGGQTRQISVINGLRVIPPKTDLLLIHDGVRPFIGRNNISLLIHQTRRYGAAVLGVPVKATIKKIKNGFVEETLNRDELWEIGTPQVFRKDLVLQAYKKFGDTRVTDDAWLVEKLGVKVKIIRGSYSNIKITTPEDLIIAEAILKSHKF